MAATEFTLFVTSGDARDAKGDFFAVPDALDEATATAFARKMARWHADERMSSVVLQKSKTVDLFTLLNITDPGKINLEKVWAPTQSGPPHRDDIDHQYHWGSDWMRIPVAVDEHGNVVALNLREPHEMGGMGFHMVIVGTTGSGKTEFLTTLINSACLTHSPESLIICAFDYKGSALVHRIRHWPHVVGAESNLRNDPLLSGKRVDDVLRGEGARRQRLLDRAGVGDVAEYEYLRIHGGEKQLPSIPHMLVIVDEFTQMFLEVEGAKELFDWLARQGRSLGMRLVMGSQRLGFEMQSGILGNMPIHVALRTEGEGDSAAMIGNDEANRLPADPPGAGLMQVGKGGRRVRFQTAYSAQVYQKPREVAAAAVREEAEYMAPQVFTATPMATLKQPVAPVAAQDKPEDRLVIGDDGRPMKQFQMAEKSVAEQYTGTKRVLWLPPLTSLPADELVRRMRGGKPWWEDYATVANPSSLHFPVGLDDRPFEARQTVYAKDLTQANCVVMGRGQSGRTTAVATMITGGALLYSPHRVQFHVIALSGTELNDVRDLPHVGTFARDSDPDKVRRIVAEMVTVIRDREAAFARLHMKLADFRDRKFGGAEGEVPADRFGDVFLVIDGWSAFVRDFESLVPLVERVLSKGPNCGVHGIISADGWVPGKLTLDMKGNLTTNVELRLAETDDYTTNNTAVSKHVPFGAKTVYLDEEQLQKRTAAGGHDGDGLATDDDEDTVTVHVAGRGCTEGKAGFHFQTGLPRISMQGRSISSQGAGEVILSKVGADAAAAPVRMLPARIPFAEVLGRFESTPAPHTRVPYGISEIGLEPAAIDFAATPHLLLTGLSRCGLSTAVSTLARSVMRRYSPEQAQLHVVDPLMRQLQVVEGAHLGAYVYEQDPTRALARELAALLETRRPRGTQSQTELAQRRKSWTGPEIFVLVDNEELVSDWANPNVFDPERSGHPLVPLVELAAQGADIGLHLIVARRLDYWAKAAMSPMVGPLAGLKVPGVVMNADPGEGIVMGIKGVAMPPGRGTYVDGLQGVASPVQIAVSEPEDAPAVPVGREDFGGRHHAGGGVEGGAGGGCR